MKISSSFIAKVTLCSFFLLAIAPAVIPALSSAAFAASGTTNSATADNNKLVDVMCNVMQLVTGNAGKAFAAFAIVSVGIGFFTGKISWGLMIAVAFGIGAMFGAPAIVSVITGKSTYDCSGA